ncbi:hypothetical protein LOK49_LG08G00377 [Camellia lanceoleosa]|uniref:Uncharacterized protein n=1 Tax=Camellia lanceoleosa TaxID=1840588 RepID=A0ACC0GW28_9ERIC|nr:hypothetical protein LOK49_LG08G00377 [Camellia lanceoleosa]
MREHDMCIRVWGLLKHCECRWKFRNGSMNNSSLDSPATAAGLTNGKKILNKLDSVSNTKLEASNYDMTAADYCMTQKSSPKTPVKRRNQEPVYEPMLSRFANEGGLIGSSPAEVSKGNFFKSSTT